MEDFVAAYTVALEQGDADFLFDRLLPDLTDAFGAQLCRDLGDTGDSRAVSNYQLSGDITGPSSRTLSVSGTAIPVEDYYEGPVSFTFEGQSFETMAAWVVADGQVYWVGECR